MAEQYDSTLEAQRLLSVIDSRIGAATGSTVERTWAIVAVANALDADCYLYGDTVASVGFRYANGVVPNVGDRVRVAIDRQKQDRWIEEVVVSSAYSKVEFDINDGVVRFGSGAAAPTASLYYAASSILRLDSGGAASPSGLQVLSTSGQRSYLAASVAGDTNSRSVLYGDATLAGLAFGPGNATQDTSLYRSAVNALKTLGTFTATGSIQIDPASGATVEGGEISLMGAGAYSDWVFDNYQGVLRWFVGGSVYMSLSSTDLSMTGTITAGSALRSTGDTYVGSYAYIGTGAAYDTYIYRAGVNVLALSGSTYFRPGDTTGQVLVGNVGPSSLAGIVFGSSGDTNIYRAGANLLKTDDDFHAVGALYFGSNAHRLQDANSTNALFLTNAGAALTTWHKSITLSTNYSDPAPPAQGIQFGADVNLYRSSLNTLKTDDWFQAYAVDVSWGVSVNGSKLARYVPLPTYIQAVTDASTTTAAISNAVSSEMTGLPATGVVAVQVTVLARSTTASASNYVRANDYSDATGTNYAVIQYIGTAGYNSACVGVVTTGGTNNRQIRYSVGYGAGTITYWVRVSGYWTTE